MVEPVNNNKQVATVDDDNDRKRDYTIRLSPAGLVAFVLGAGGLGAGGIGPFISNEIAQKCYDQSATALSVAAQHGEEMLALNQAITENRRLILERTAYRWTKEDQLEYMADQDRRHDMAERRIELLEKTTKQR